MRQRSRIPSSWKGTLKDKAFRTEATLGRKYNKREDLDDVFLSDFTKVASSALFRRLGGVAQVVPLAGCRFSNRLSHTNSVLFFSLYVSKALGLNENLTGAIALSHDLGHPPFAHVGEKFFTEILRKQGEEEFLHEAFGVLIAQEIGELNLSHETQQGIYCHSGSGNGGPNLTNEGKVVRIVDNVVFVFQDIEELERAGIKDKDISSLAKYFGGNTVKRIVNTLHALIEESVARKEVFFVESDLAKKFCALRRMAYESLYSKADQDQQFVPELLGKSLEIVGNNGFFAGCNPIAASALMTEQEVAGIVEKSQSSTLRRSDFSSLLVADYLRYLRSLGDIKSFSKADFRWASERKRQRLDL